MAGYRVALERHRLTHHVRGHYACFKIPPSNKINDAGNVCYFFCNMNTDNGVANYDAGIYRKNGIWNVFTFGTGGWENARLSFNPEGKWVSIGLIISEHNSTFRLEVIVDDIVEMTIQGLAKHQTPFWHLYNSKIRKTSAEVTLVPNENNWTNFNKRLACAYTFIKESAISKSYPLKSRYSKYRLGKHKIVMNCDDMDNFGNTVNYVCDYEKSTSRSISNIDLDINNISPSYVFK